MRAAGTAAGHSPVAAPVDPVRILRDAANHIRTSGLGKNSYVNHKGYPCMLTALAVAAGHPTPDGEGFEPMPPWYLDGYHDSPLRIAVAATAAQIRQRITWTEDLQAAGMAVAMTDSESDKTDAEDRSVIAYWSDHRNTSKTRAVRLLEQAAANMMKEAI